MIINNQPWNQSLHKDAEEVGQNKGAKNGAGGRKTGKTRVNFVYSLTFESRQFPRAITYDDDLYSFFFLKELDLM